MPEIKNAVRLQVHLIKTFYAQSCNPQEEGRKQVSGTQESCGFTPRRSCVPGSVFVRKEGCYAHVLPLKAYPQFLMSNICFLTMFRMEPWYPLRYPPGKPVASYFLGFATLVQCFCCHWVHLSKKPFRIYALKSRLPKLVASSAWLL